jgi:TonB-dependent SusC/RagA subfamily outer membrane receptor
MTAMRSVALSLFVVAGSSVACATSQTRNPESNSTVTSENLDNSNESLESALQKRVPGLIVRNNGDGVSLMIRGSTSITGSDTPPLYILNGLPFEPGPGGVVTGVSLADIESVKVLKGGEAALYGINGANGVIVITTKRAGKR